MILELKAYKDKRNWYIDDSNGYSKEDNQLVLGIPEIIERVVGNKIVKVKLSISNMPFIDSIIMTKINSNTSGVWYNFNYKNWDMKGWLCKVFYHYFSEAPETLYARIDGEI